MRTVDRHERQRRVVGRYLVEAAVGEKHDVDQANSAVAVSSPCGSSRPGDADAPDAGARSRCDRSALTASSARPPFCGRLHALTCRVFEGGSCARFHGSPVRQFDGLSPITAC